MLAIRREMKEQEQFLATIELKQPSSLATDFLAGGQERYACPPSTQNDNAKTGTTSHISLILFLLPHFFTAHAMLALLISPLAKSSAPPT